MSCKGYAPKKVTDNTCRVDVGQEYVVDTVSCNGHHKCVAVWKYDKRDANGAKFVYHGMTLVSGKVPRSISEYCDSIEAEGGSLRRFSRASPVGIVWFSPLTSAKIVYLLMSVSACRRNRRTCACAYPLRVQSARYSRFLCCFPFHTSCSFDGQKSV